MSIIQVYEHSFSSIVNSKWICLKCKPACLVFSKWSVRHVWFILLSANSPRAFGTLLGQCSKQNFMPPCSIKEIAQTAPKHFQHIHSLCSKFWRSAVKVVNKNLVNYCSSLSKKLNTHYAVKWSYILFWTYTRKSIIKCPIIYSF